MKQTTKKILKELIEKYPNLSVCERDIKAAFSILQETFSKDKKLLLCGNGGSAADCEHIVGELVKSFKKKRPLTQTENKELCAFEHGVSLAPVLEKGLKAVSLTSHLALSTAFANDKEPLAVFAQQLYVLGEQGDTLLALSTSGNSKNCVYAATVAKWKGMKILSMTGKNDSALSNMSDICIQVPETETYKIQELHLPIYHCLCAMLEEEFF